MPSLVRLARALPPAASACVAVVLAACNPVPPEGTGGTDVEAGPFGRGVVTINVGQSYDSTNVSLVGIDGRRLSESFISSTSLLTSDVTAPTMPASGDDVVLLDRKSGVLTWVDVRTAAIRSQFHTDGDERAKNPWDYLPVSDTKAYVTRYDPWPGNGEHGDVIVVDPRSSDEVTTVAKRIAVAPALDLPSDVVVHPARGLVAGDRAYVMTVNATAIYEYATSFLVAIDTATDEVVATVEMTDLRDCTGMAISPDKTELAIVCSGDLHADEPYPQQRSALVLLDRESLTEVKRWNASALGIGPVGFSVSYASSRTILFSMFGNNTVDTNDRAVWLDLDTGDVREVHRSGPVEIGGVLCPARLDGATEGADPPACFVSDAAAGRLLRFAVEDGHLGSPQSLVVDQVVGLPPRYLGQF